jgi:hypothetical protein
MSAAPALEESRALAAYAARDDLTSYGSNGLLLFALQLRFGVQDVEGIAATSLTDGPNDKKCDLVYVDRGEARVVVAQAYAAADESKSEAPANKAAELNTAASWLLASDLDTLPEPLRSAAAEVRDALGEDEIRDFEIWYVHNLPESDTSGGNSNKQHAPPTATSSVTSRPPRSRARPRRSGAPSLKISTAGPRLRSPLPTGSSSRCPAASR